MKKNASLIGLVAVLAMVASSCAPKLLVNKEYRHKLRRGKDKLLIMPVVFHGFPKKMTKDLETTTFVNFITRFGKYGYSVQPLRHSFDAAGFGNLPYRLTMALYQIASVHGSPHLSEHRRPTWMSPMLAAARKFANWAPYALRIGGVQIPADEKFRYILTAIVKKIGSRFGGDMIRYRVIGGIVDVKTQQIVGVTWFEGSSKTDTVSIISDIGDIGLYLQKALAPVFVK